MNSTAIVITFGCVSLTIMFFFNISLLNSNSQWLHQSKKYFYIKNPMAPWWGLISDTTEFAVVIICFGQSRTFGY